MKKLVRDRIPEIIASRWETSDSYLASQEEYRSALFEKLREEAEEVIAEQWSPQKLKEELADLSEVFDSILRLYEISRAEISEIQAQKRVERGGFEKGYILKLQ